MPGNFVIVFYKVVHNSVALLAILVAIATPVVLLAIAMPVVPFVAAAVMPTEPVAFAIAAHMAGQISVEIIEVRSYSVSPHRTAAA